MKRFDVLFDYQGEKSIEECADGEFCYATEAVAEIARLREAILDWKEHPDGGAVRLYKLAKEIAREGR